MSKKCVVCQTENDSDTIFCYQCGSEIDKYKSESSEVNGIKFRVVVIPSLVVAIIMFAMVFSGITSNQDENIGSFTLIKEELSVKYKQIASNQTITIYAESLSMITYYFINVSEYQYNISLSWSVFIFENVANYDFTYRISSAFINCTALSIELWEHHEYKNDFFLLDWIFIKV